LLGVLVGIGRTLAELVRLTTDWGAALFELAAGRYCAWRADCADADARHMARDLERLPRRIRRHRAYAQRMRGVATGHKLRARERFLGEGS
jgi:hypothetical protein